MLHIRLTQVVIMNIIIMDSPPYHDHDAYIKSERSPSFCLNIELSCICVDIRRCSSSSLCHCVTRPESAGFQLASSSDVSCVEAKSSWGSCRAIVFKGLQNQDHAQSREGKPREAAGRAPGEPRGRGRGAEKVT